MSQDLRPILAGWDFDSDRVQVRAITGDDGTEKIQMRIDLGLMQMEVDGRPDGERPHGHESLLEHYESAQQGAAAAADEFALGPEDVRILMHEGLQYYHRYLSAFHLGRFDLVARDTARNLRLFAFVVKHAVRQRDRIEFDRYRPYVAMMYYRARASQALAQGDHRAASSRSRTASARSVGSSPTTGRTSTRVNARNCSSCSSGGRIERERPLGPIEQLEQQLEVSVKLEDYEEAARIPDQIRRLQEADPREHRRLGSS